MTTKKVFVWQCKCDRPNCGHEWTTRTSDKPKVCPRCKQKDWNKPRKKAAAIKLLERKKQEE